MMEGARHGLAGNFRRAIEVLVVEGMVLRHRLFDRITVDGCRGGIDEPFYALGDAGLQHVERAAHVDVEGRAWIFVTLQKP